MGIKIYGYSDDVVGIEGHVNDEFGSWDRPTTLKIGDARGGLFVTMRYAHPRADGERSGTWSAQVEQLDGGVIIPWDVRVTHEVRERGGGVGYTAVVHVACPEGTTIERVEANDD